MKGNWTHNQMWLNGILSPSNPLAENLVNNLADNAEFYGVDPEGPWPFESNENNVVVPELNITVCLELFQKAVLGWFDLLQSSTQIGIDVFVIVEECI